MCLTVAHWNAMAVILVSYFSSSCLCVIYIFYIFSLSASFTFLFGCRWVALLCLLNLSDMRVTVKCCYCVSIQQRMSKRQRVEPAPSLETAVVAKKKPVAATSRMVQSRTTRQKTAAAVTTTRPAVTARGPASTVAAPKPPPAKGAFYIVSKSVLSVKVK